jgi:protein TonB
MPLPVQPSAPHPAIAQRISIPTVLHAPNPTIVQQSPKPAFAHAPTSHPKAISPSHAKPKAHYMAAHATGVGLTPNISSAHIGLPGPRPDYPAEAFFRREGGTVHMVVVFGSSGEVQSAEVQQSSGFHILDTYTRAFIYAHWKNASFANSTISIPIIYDPGKITSAGP